MEGNLSKPIGYVSEVINSTDNIDDLFYIKPGLYPNYPPYITEYSLILVSKKPHAKSNLDMLLYNEGTPEDIKLIFIFPIFLDGKYYYEDVCSVKDYNREIKQFERHRLIGFVRKVIFNLIE